MAKIDDFLGEAVEESKLGLARINIAGGGRKPFYCVQIPSFSQGPGRYTHALEQK